MFAVFAKLKIKSDKVEQFLSYAGPNARGARTEPGCLRFDVIRDETSPTTFYLYELYRDKAAFATHQEMPYFKAFFEGAGDTLVEPPEGLFGETLFRDDTP